MENCLIIALFVLGYSSIVFEHYLKVNKSAVAVLMAVGCWGIYLVNGGVPIEEGLEMLSDHFSGAAQIVFFLIGAMAIVEIVDAHGGFKIITDLIQTKSQKKLMWIMAFVTFFLSAILDNLTTTILMVSLVRKLIQKKEDRFLLCCLVVLAANAGGAWTPIGDVTTTMLWIDGRVSSFLLIKKLFLPSIVSLLVPLAYFSFKEKETKELDAPLEQKRSSSGRNLIFVLGVMSLVFVPILKALTGLPPFMGVLLGLSLLWLVTDFLHGSEEEKAHLRMPSILSKIDISSAFFFLGILLAVSALETAQILSSLSVWLGSQIASLELLATLIGLFSAVVDNVPLVAATMGMYAIEQFPTDSPLWLMIAYAAGVGGNILIIGSAAGVALMGIEKINFIEYMKKISFPALIGYLAGMGVYILLN